MEGCRIKVRVECSRDSTQGISAVCHTLNGSTAAGLAFARFYQRMPGDSGPIKGFVSGALGWLVMDLIFFPLLGLGLFAMKLGLGLWPALFSLAMMLTYSVVMGTVYGMIYATNA